MVTANESHPLPLVPGGISLLLFSIFDSANGFSGQSIPWMLGSLFQLRAPTILSSAFHTPNEPPRLDPAGEGVTDKGKGKARAVDSDNTNQPGQEPAAMEDDAVADAIRQAMAASRWACSHVPNEAGPSGSSTSTLTSNIALPLPSSTLLPQIHPSGSDSEQAEIDHAILMSSLEHIGNSLHTLQVNFTFPTRLDCHMPSDTDSHAPSINGEDANGCIAAYLPTTSADSTVFNFVQDLRGLLRQLDHVDIENEVGAEAMKEKVAGVINTALEGVENEVAEVIGRWMSLQATM